LNSEILAIQHELIYLMGELALLDEDRSRYEQANGHATAPAAIDRLTTLVHETESRVSLTGWSMPGGTPLGAALDFARTVCRRAERRAMALRQLQPTLNPEIIRYLNRLSDLCFVWARDAENSTTPAPASA
jgi:cob(I)alamin adenosyltransferase